MTQWNCFPRVSRGSQTKRKQMVSCGSSKAMGAANLRGFELSGSHFPPEQSIRDKSYVLKNLQRQQHIKWRRRSCNSLAIRTQYNTSYLHVMYLRTFLVTHLWTESTKFSHGGNIVSIYSNCTPPPHPTLSQNIINPTCLGPGRMQLVSSEKVGRRKINTLFTQSSLTDSGFFF